jgi:hypothetical protein
MIKAAQMEFVIVIGAFPIVIGAVPQLSAHQFRFGVLHVDPSMITTVSGATTPRRAILAFSAAAGS